MGAESPWPYGYTTASARITARANVVIARSSAYGRVTVPIVVAGGQRTEIHLDGAGWTPPNTGTNFVRMSNGEFVGWAANVPVAK